MVPSHHNATPHPHRTPHHDVTPGRHILKAPLKSKPVFSKPPPVSIVGAHPFARLCNQPGVQLFTMSFSDIDPQPIEVSSATALTSSTESELHLIPKEYRDLTELFS